MKCTFRSCPIAVLALAALGGFLLPQAAQGQVTLDFAISGSDQNRATPILDLREGQTFTVTVTATGAIPAGGIISAVIIGADADISAPTGNFTANGRTGIRFNLSASQMSHAQTWTVTDDMAREGLESKTLRLYHDAFVTASLAGTTVSVNLNPGSTGANRSRSRLFNILESDEHVLVPQLQSGQSVAEGQSTTTFDIVLAAGTTSPGTTLSGVYWYVTFDSSDPNRAAEADFVVGGGAYEIRGVGPGSGRRGAPVAGNGNGQVQSTVAATPTSSNIFRIKINNDNLMEADETFTLHLGGPTNDPGISYGSVDLAIADNDGYTLNVLAPSPAATEGGTPNARVQFVSKRGGGTLGSAQTVTLTVTNDVAPGHNFGGLNGNGRTCQSDWVNAGADDCNAPGKTLFIVACALPATLAHNAMHNCALRAVVDDMRAERDEHYRIALSFAAGTPAGVTIGDPVQAVIAASDPVSISLGDPVSVNEGQSAALRINISAAEGVVYGEDNILLTLEYPTGTLINTPSFNYADALAAGYYDWTVTPAGSADDTIIETHEVREYVLRGARQFGFNVQVGTPDRRTVTFLDDEPVEWTVRARGNGIQSQDTGEGAGPIASPDAADTATDHADTMYFRFAQYHGPGARGSLTFTYCLGGSATGGSAAQVTANPAQYDYAWPGNYDPASTSAADSDYAGTCTTGRGTFTVNDGDDIYRLGITLNDDNLNEGDETITAELVAVSSADNYPDRVDNNVDDANINYDAVGVFQATRTIKDNDAISISIANAGSDADGDTAGFQVQEGGDATFTVTMDHASAGPITVAYAISGDVTAADYTDRTAAVDPNTATNGMLVIPAGATGGTITIGLAQDAADTASEALTVTLGAITPGSGVGSVAVDSSPENNAATQNVVTRPVARTFVLRRTTDDYSTAATGSALAESAGALYFAVTLAPGSNDPFTSATVVTWTATPAGATGTAAADFSAATGAFTWPANDATCSADVCRFSFDITDDNLDEPDSEGFSVVLSVADATADGGTNVGTGVTGLSIADNDNFTVDITTSDTTLNEGEFAVVTLTPTKPAARQVTMGYDHPGSNAESGLANTAATTDVDATLPTGGAAGGDFGALRTGAGNTEATTTEGFTVTFPANSFAPQYLLIPIAADNLNEPAETFHLFTFSVSISGQYSGGYVLPTASADPARGNGLTFTIAASDAMTVSIARVGGAAINERQTARFTVTLAGASAGSAAAVTVPYTVALDGPGYTIAEVGGAAGSLQIDAGETSGTISIPLPVSASLTSGAPAQTLTVTLTAADPAASPAVAGPTTAAGGGAVMRSGTASEQSGAFTISFVDAVRTLTVTGPATIAENNTRSGVESGDYTITLSGQAFAADTTVTWTVSHGGTADADFVAASDRGGTVTFGASDGDTSTKTFTLTVAYDYLNEADETFTVQVGIADPTADGGTAYGDPATTAIADNNDILIALYFVDSTVAENAAAGTSFGITISGGTGDVTVPFVLSGLDDAEYDIDAATPMANRATLIIDADGDSGRLVFAPGDSNVFTVAISLNDDNLNEAAETLTLTGGTPSAAGDIAYVALNNGVADVMVTDTDAITVSIARASGAPSTVEEGAAATFTITLAGASAGSAAAITVPYTVGSSGSYDVSGAAGSVVIPAGGTTADLTINLPNDNALGASSPTQTVTVAIPAPNPQATPPVAGVTVAAGGGSVTRHGTNNAASVTVSFREAAPTLTVTGPATLTETDADFETANYTITLTGSAFASDTAITWTVTHGTTEAADFSAVTGSVTFGASDAAGSAKNFTITIAGDDVNEADETFTIQASGGGSGTMYGTPQSVTLNDDDAITYSIAVDNAMRNEPTDAMMANAVNAVFTVTLSGMSAGDVTIPIVASGSATAGTDYATAPASVTITAGQTTASFTRGITHDDIAEAAETIVLTVAAENDMAFSKTAAAGTVTRATAAADQSATVTIPANDALSIAIARKAGESGNIAETGTGRASFTVTVTGTSAETVSVPFTVSGTNITADDYDITAPTGIMATATGGTLTIAAGAGQTGEITIQASDDSEAELAETLSVNLGTAASVGAGTITSSGSATVGITDNDGVSATVAAATATTVTESSGGSSFSIPVTLGAAHAHDVTFAVAFGSTTALTDNDAEAADRGTPTGLTISSGTTGTIMIPVTDDNLNEGDETFTVTITANTVGRMGGPSIPVSVSGAGASQTLTISDDTADATTVTITKTVPTGATIGENGDGAATADVTFRVALSGGIRTGAITVPVAFSGLIDGEYDILTPAMGDYDNDANTADTAPPASATGLTLTFGTDGTPAADDHIDITVNLIGDTLNEAAETFALTGEAAGASGLRIAVGSVDYAGSGGNAASISVTDDDPLVFTLQRTFTGADQRRDTDEGREVSYSVRMDSGDGAGGIDFNKDVAIGANPITVAWRVIGSAVEGDIEAEGADFDQDNDDAADAALPSGTLTFPAGTETRRSAATQRFVLRIFDDDFQEPAEAFAVEIDAPTGTNIGAATVARNSSPHDDVTITASDPIFVTIARAAGQAATVAENAASVSFTVALSGGIRSGTVTVPVSFSGLENSEYDIIAPTGDYDNDASTDDTAPPAANTGVTIVFGTGGTVTATDSVTVTVRLNDDSLNEATETLTLTGAAKGMDGLRIAGGDINYTNNGDAASVQVTDNDAVTYSIADASAVTEVDSGGTNPTMQFTVSLSGASAGDVTIPYTLAGSATGGSDYTTPSPLTVTISAGDTSETIDITVLADNENEDAETITVTLAAESHASFSKTAAAGAVTLSATSGANTGRGTINDDDGATVTLTGGGNVNEGDDATVTFTLSSEATGRVTVRYTIGATAALTDDDAEAADTSDTSGGNITIDTTSTHTGTITISAVDDMLNEADETFTVAATSASTTSAGVVNVADSPQVFTIKDAADDAIAVTIAKQTPSGDSVVESGRATFRVTLAGGTRTADVVVPFAVSGLAHAEFDITGPAPAPAASATMHTVTFPASSAGTTDMLDITIDLHGDEVNEPTETLTVTGNANDHASAPLTTAGDIDYTNNGRIASVNVTDDDDITVTIADSADINEGGTASFGVTLDHASATAVTVNYRVTAGGGTAPPFTDAGNASRPAGTTASNGSITINAGDTTGTIRVTSTMSNADTGTGTLTVTLTTHTAAGTIAGSGSQSATVTYRAVSRSFSVAVDTGMGKTVDRDSATTNVVEVDEGDTVYFTVTLTGDAVVAGSDATVTWGPTGDSDTSGAQLTFTSANWQTAQEISIVARADDINEGDETVGVMLRNAMGGGGLGSGITTAAASVTVPANDPITYAIAATASGTETDSATAAVTVTVTLTGATESAWTNIEVPFSVHSSSTATPTSDYTVSSSPLTFTGTDLEEDITVTITADQVNEANETVVIDLGTPTHTGNGGGELTAGTTTRSTVTINDDDDITVSIAAVASTVSELETAQFTFTLSGDSEQDVVVPFMLTGTADAPGDYTDPATLSVTIDADAPNHRATLSIPITHDMVDAGTSGEAQSESMIVTLSNPMQRGVTASGSATVNITDVITVRTLTVTRTSAAGEVNEGATVNFQVELTGDSFDSATDVTWAVTLGDTVAGDFTGARTASVRFAATDTAGSANARKTFSVRINDDNLNEAAETFTVNMTGLDSVTADGADASVTIAASDPITVTVARSGAAAVAEATPVNTVNFTVTLSGGVRTTAVTVPFTVSGTNVEDGDYNITAPTGIAANASGGAITFTAATASTVTQQTITVTVLDDDLNEAEETLTITGTAAGASGLRVATGGGSITYATNGNTANVRITDNDAISVTITQQTPASGAAADEAASATFRVALSGGVRTSVVTVPFAFTGTLDNAEYAITAPSGLMADATGGSITFATAGATATDHADITVNLQGDTVNEATETLILTGAARGTTGLRVASGGGSIAYATGGNTVTLEVSDDDAFTYAIEATESGTEADPGGAAVTVTVTVTLSGATATASGGIEVPFSVASSSTAGSDDYTISASPLTFTGTSNETEDITVTITADDINEANETVVINLGTATHTGTNANRGGTLTAGTATSTVTINDDDTIAATFSAPTASIQEGQQHTVTVNLDHASAGVVTVPFTVTPGGDNNPPFSIGSGASVTAATSGSIMIPANTQSGTFTVTSTPTNTINTGSGTLTVTFGTLTTGDGGGTVGSSGMQVITVTFREFERFFAVTADDADTTEGDTVVFTVGFTTNPASTDVDSATPATVQWALTGVDTAADLRSNYPTAATDRTLTFRDNTAQTVRVTIATDNLNEAAETLTLTLSNATGGGGTGSGINTFSDSVTIAASDPIALAATATANVSEGGNAVVNVDLGALPSRDVTVGYTIGTDIDAATVNAVADDYTDSNSGSITITAAGGVATGMIAIGIDRDNLNEPAETFTVTITAADIDGEHGTATVASGGAQTFTIAASDPITYGIARASGTMATEDEGRTAEFTVSISGASAGSAARIQVPYTVTSSGAYNVAAGARSGMVTFAANSAAAQTITLALPTDGNLGASAADQTLTVTLGTPSLGAGGGRVTRGIARAQVRVNFVDAARTLTVTGPATHAETDSDSTVRYMVTLGGRAFAAATTVTWTVTPGTAAAADFAAVTGTIQFPTTATFNVTVAGDNLNEAAETFTVQLSVADATADGGTAYGSPATTRITDDDTITATLSGGGGSVAEGADAAIMVALSGATHTADVVFSYNTDDAAGTLTLAPGVNSGMLTITATNDALAESAETFTVDADTLTATTAGAITIAAPQMFTITANDDITVTVAADAARTVTGRAANFTVNLSNASMAAVTVTYDTSGVVTAAGGTAAIPAGQTSAGIAVAVPADAVAEGETGMLAVTLTGVTVAPGGGMAMLGAPAGATMTIIGDNAADRAARVAPATVAVAKGIGKLAAHAIGARLNFTGGNALSIAGHSTASTEAVVAWAVPFLQTGRRPTMEGLLRQFGFAFSVGGGGLNFWGGGDYTSTKGDHDGVTYDGDLSALHFGVDTSWNNGLLGVAISRSGGDTKFTAAGMNSMLETSVASVHPYLTRQFNKTKLWATVGWGVGDADVKEPGALVLATDITVTTAALGITYEHDAPAATIAARLGAFYSRSELDAAESAGRRLPKVTADSLRLNAGAELSRRFAIGLRPFLSLNHRRDSGDGDTGGASDLGGGVEWHSPAATLRLAAAKSVTADGPEEQRLDFTVHKTAGRLSINLNLTADSAGLNTANLLGGEWRF